MTYDFTSLMNRRGKDAIAVDALTDTPPDLPPPSPSRALTSSPCGWRI